MSPFLRLGVLFCLSVLPAAQAAWVIETIAGTGYAGFTGDFGKAKEAMIDYPMGMARGPDGALWFAEYGGHRIRHIRPNGLIFTVVGNGKRGLEGNGGSAAEASLSMPHEIRFDPFGNLYIADTGNQVVRRVDGASQRISSLAGTGLANYGGDGGPAHLAYLRQPRSIQFGRDACLYICDTGNHLIRRVNMATGEISTVLGTGSPGPTVDGAPLQGSAVAGPRAVNVDGEGNLWFSTRDGHQVFKIDLLEERVHLMAGTGEKGYSGDGGPAKKAVLHGPKGLAVDPAGNVWIADTENFVVRRIDAQTGVIETVAGTGQRGDGPDGDPLGCGLSRVQGIFIDKDGSVFLADSENHKIRVLRDK